MSVTLNVNGATYDYPERGDTSWGPDATDWASAVTSGMLQKAGGNGNAGWGSMTSNILPFAFSGGTGGGSNAASGTGGRGGAGNIGCGGGGGGEGVTGGQGGNGGPGLVVIVCW